MDYETLNTPLGEKEQEQLLRLEAQFEIKRAQGEELDPEVGEVLAELWQRQNRPKDLKEFRTRYESKYFDEWEGDNRELEHWKVFNYPAKVECYQQKRQYRTTDQSVRQLIAAERKVQPELKEQAKSNANLRGDRAQIEIKFDLIERVYNDYEQFLVKELEGLEQAQADKLTLRQAAILYYFTQQQITENNVANLATAKGYKSKTSGKQLLEKYAAWCELQESELPDSTRELGALQKDLERVLPQLTGKAAATAKAYLKRVIEKKKRGL